MTLCDPVAYTVGGILQGRILEWVAYPFSWGSSQPRDRTWFSYTAGRFLTHWARREAQGGVESVAKRQSIQIQTSSTSNKCRKGCGEKGTLLHCWRECKLLQPLWKSVWRFLKKLKIGLPYNPGNPTVGPVSGENTNSKTYMCSCVHCSAAHKSQDREATSMFVDRRWMKERCRPMVVYCSAWKEWNNAICSGTDGPRDYHIKWARKTNNHFILLTCGI